MFLNNRRKQDDVDNRGIGLRAASMAALLVVTLALVSATPLWGDEPTVNVDDARARLEEWVKVRRLISREKRDWALAKELLSERIALVDREVGSIQEKIADAQKSVTESDKKRQEFLDESEQQKALSKVLADRIGALEERARTMLKRLPDPIRERVKPLSQKMPTGADADKMSLSQRFQNVIGMLNEINKFNREITMATEVRTLPDGSSAEVTTVYIGVSRGYYLSANGAVAGLGAAGPDGWVWKPANEYADRIAKTIAILKNEEVASFVVLPTE